MNRTTRNPRDDEALARGLAADDPRHLADFVGRFEHPLKTGAGRMKTELQASHPPGCQQPFENLTPHIGNRSGAGYLMYRPADRALATHVARLFLDQLFLVAAGLRRDPRASTCLDDMSREIAECVARRFRRPCNDLVREDGPGHLWLSSGSAGRDMRSREGHAAPLPRLASYLGVSPLRAWMFATLYNLGRDCVRLNHGTIPLGPRVDDDGEDEATGFDATAVPELTAEDWEFARKHHHKIKRKLNQSLAELADKEAENADSRLHKFAYLWLYCRFRKSDVAAILTISRAAGSQQVKAIREHIKERTKSAAEEIVERVEEIDARTEHAATSSELSRERIERLLWTIINKEEPGYFFDPILFHFVLDAYRDLGRKRPELLWTAYLHWLEKVPRQQISERMCECVDASSQVDRLLLELADWHHAVTQAAAERVEAECGVAAQTLYGWIYPLIPKWLGDVGGNGSGDST